MSTIINHKMNVNCTLHHKCIFQEDLSAYVYLDSCTVDILLKMVPMKNQHIKNSLACNLCEF